MELDFDDKFCEELLETCFSVVVLPASSRGTNKLYKWCNISCAYGLGSSATGFGTEVLETVRLESHSQYTLTHSLMVSC